ncbi:MAG: glycosyltransferase family 4 protein [Sphaerochaetaceae bacterium]|nr:glycosyltransferase family 4 protein [Sphaerochaetaceae bacterium]
MNREVGIIHYKTGSTDGVSLEIEKWKQVIEDAGHRVHLASGLHEHEGEERVTVIEELNYHSEAAERLYRGTFISLEAYGEDRAGYEEDLSSQREALLQQLSSWVTDNSITVLIVENMWSVGLHPAAADALLAVAGRFHLHVLAHHHDFYWEKITPLCLTCNTAMEIADTLFPPHSATYSHVVINSLAQSSLLHRKGIQSTVIPNVFDFHDQPTRDEGFSPDEFNSDLRSRIGLSDEDIMVLQATRIVPRKGIEMAIDTIAAMNSLLPAYTGKDLYDGRKVSTDTQIVLVLAGYAEDDETGSYLEMLKRYAAERNVNVLHVNHLVDSHRSEKPLKRYSLWDTYARADLVTYPSYWEGWGNQLLEAIKARIPVILYEYPVFRSDIQPSGLEMISLGSNGSRNRDGRVSVDPDTYRKAAESAFDVLTNSVEYEKMVEHNFSIGKEHFSMDALKRHLNRIMESWG